MIHVFKFGGASVKDADGVKNLTKIINLNREKQLLIVVSAMGKTTNTLEMLTRSYVDQQNDVYSIFDAVRTYHDDILHQLFEDRNHPIYDEIANTLVEIDWIIEEEPHDEYDFIYDQMVSIGEMLASKIVSAYLKLKGIENKWLDSRSFIHTDNTYREGVVDWDKTQKSIQSTIPQLLENHVAVTQGFIGGTSENFTTTLGREGSDYSAAIFAACLNAKSVTIWKDVPGVLNADPKLFSDTQKYEELSYREALEMTFYGATVIHPKTIKPLQNAGIPLFVKPFLLPFENGTCIKEDHVPISVPAIIVKKNQVLLTVSTLDLSFITENHLSNLFGVFADKQIKINMMQLSASSYSVCFDNDERRVPKLIAVLESQFKLKYNTGLELLTVRHFNNKIITELTSGKTILLEQSSRQTSQMVLKNA